MGSEDSDIISYKMFDDDFFGLPLEPLQDFNALEATDLDSLLDQFEATTEKWFREEFYEDLLANDDLNDGENLVVSSCSTKSNSVSVSVVSDKVVHNHVVANHQNSNNTNSSVSNNISNCSPTRKSKSRLLNSNRKNRSMKRKSCGISLLAKPTTKVQAIERRVPKRPTSPTRFAHYFYQDHDYCPTPRS